MTGGGSGIGAALAQRFHDRGNTVIVAGRRAEVLQGIVAGRPNMHALELDVDSAAGHRRFCRAAARRPSGAQRARQQRRDHAVRGGGAVARPRRCRGHDHDQSARSDPAHRCPDRSPRGAAGRGDRQRDLGPGLRAARHHADLQRDESRHAFLHGRSARGPEGQGGGDRARTAGGADISHAGPGEPPRLSGRSMPSPTR